MKKILVPVFFVVAAAALTYTVTTWTVTAKVEAQAGFRAAVLEMQLEFMRNNSLLRPITDLQNRPDLQRYLNEANVLASWYFKNPAKKVWDAFPERNKPEAIIEDYRLAAKEEGPRQRSAQGNLPIREECYKMVREAYDELKGGNYRAIASDFQGSVRFDAHKVIRDGNKLRWEFIAWGGIGELVYSGWNMRMFKKPTAEEVAEYEKELAQAKRRGEQLEMGDPRTQHFAESTSSAGNPVLPMFEGGDYIIDFPPGARMNYFVTPACPPDAEEVEMKFKVKARAMSGEDQAMEYSFRVPVDGAWKGSWEGVQKIEAAETY